MDQFVIYIIRCSINGKAYIGKTGRPRFRWYVHKSIAKRCAGKRIGESALYRAMRKYGAENFTFKILERCRSEAHAFERERYWIAAAGTFGPRGYNMSAGGEGQTGFKHPEKSKLKMARHGPDNGCYGRVWTEEERARHRERALQQFAEKGYPFMGRTHSAETRAKLSAAAMGNKRCLGRKMAPRSQKAREQQSQNMKRVWATLNPEQREKQMAAARAALKRKRGSSK